MLTDRHFYAGCFIGAFAMYLSVTLNLPFWIEALLGICLVVCIAAVAVLAGWILDHLFDGINGE